MIPVTKPLSLKGKFFATVREGSLDILMSPSLFGNNRVYPREFYDQGTKNPTNVGNGKTASGNRKKA